MSRDGLPPDLVRDGIRRGNSVEMRVHGASMIPLIPPGSVVTIGPADRGHLRPGGIAAVAINGHTVCHRIREVREDGTGLLVLTEGLSTRVPDPPSREAHVVGVVTSVRWGRFRVSTGGPEYAILSRIARAVGPLWALARGAWGRMGGRR